MEKDTRAKLIRRAKSFITSRTARWLRYDRPIAASLAAFKAARESTAQLLELLPDADRRRQLVTD